MPFDFHSIHVSCQDRETATHIINAINDKMTINVKELGQISRFNGVEVMQAADFVKIYNKTYIEKIMAQHTWIHNAVIDNIPVPMHHDPKYVRKLESAEPADDKQCRQLEKKYGFKFRQGIGELIYAMMMCRPDISYAVIKLSQYSTKPSEIHFQAVQHIYKYLWATKEEGITYWRTNQRHDLPKIALPALKQDPNYTPGEQRQVLQPHILNAAVNSDYAGDHMHRKSVTGLSLQLAGGSILYKTKFQDTIALSSTEAEFTAAAEAGKYIKYVRSILDELGIEQDEATTLYKDNQGALLMANAQQPTKRTRHMDIKHFALQEWCKRDLIILHKIHTNGNWADVLTKPHGKVLFYRHMNHIMGRQTPKYKQNRYETSISMLYDNEQFQHSYNYGIGGGCYNNQY